MLMFLDSDFDEDDIDVIKECFKKAKKPKKAKLSSQIPNKDDFSNEHDEECGINPCSSSREVIDAGIMKTLKRKDLSTEENTCNSVKKLRKEKKLNSRLKRLLKMKNKRTEIPDDPKLSPLFHEKDNKMIECLNEKEVVYENVNLQTHSLDKESKDSISQENNHDNSDTKISICDSCHSSKTKTGSKSCDNDFHEAESRNTQNGQVCKKSSTSKFFSEYSKEEITSFCEKSQKHLLTLSNERSHESHVDSEAHIESISNMVALESLPRSHPSPNRIVAMDCEFVGVHPKDTSALGRCTILDYHGNVLYDVFVRPEMKIWSYRTKWSGIRKRHMKNALPNSIAIKQIRDLIADKIVVGHALFNDFKVINLDHSGKDRRDTSTYKPLRTLANLPERVNPSLKNLTKAILGRTIQQSEHCSLEDCRATLDLYKLVQTEWEQSLIDREVRQEENKKDVFDNKYFNDEFWPNHIYDD